MSRIPTWRELSRTPAVLRAGMNLWPPFRGMGIRVTEVSPDYRRAKVVLRSRALTRNFVGTQFGGSMFAMSDPFWLVLVAQCLGPDYHVWDQRAEIEFIAPGRTELSTEFVVTDALLGELRTAAASGDKVLRWAENEIVDRDGVVVARVRKLLYVRLRRELRPGSAATTTDGD